MSWTDIFTRVQDGIEDLATLEVITLTGKVSTSVVTSAGRMDWGKIIESVQSASGEIRLVAATKSMIDSDMTQFVSNDAADQPNLLRLHETAVESAQQNRRAVIDFVRRILGVIPGI